MKAVLKRIKLNWRGAKNVTINFQPTVTEISGTNESGKSTILNAHKWVFTGKDIFDRKDFEIKDTKHPERNREEYFVEEAWSIDGNEQVIRRVYREVWQRTKGHETESFKGHETLLFINEVPFNLKQFTETIGAWFGETTFNILTDPMFFNMDNGAKWTWKDKRDILVSMAGKISDEEVFDAAQIGKERRAKLEEALKQGKSFDLFKKEIAQKKKKANEELEGVPQSIEKLEKVMPEKLDWNELQTKIDKENELYNNVNDSIADISKFDDEILTQTQAKKSEISTIQFDSEAIEENVKAELKKENDKIRDAVASKEIDISKLQNEISKLDAGIKTISSNVEAAQIEKSLLLGKLQREQAKKLPDIDPNETKCPTCQREFPEDKIDDLKKHFTENWNQSHVKMLESIKTSGKKTVSEINEFNVRLNANNTAKAEKAKTLQKLQGELKELQAKPLKTGSALTEALKNNKVYQSNLLKIDAIKLEIKELESKTDEAKKIQIEGLKLKRTGIDETRVELIKKLAGKEHYEKNTAEIKELKEKQKNLNQVKAELEGLEFAIQAFSATKNIEVQKRVNKMFPDSITFELFEKQVNGEEVEFCQLLYKGVPWGVVNNGGKIQAGMECIKGFNKFYNLYLPVFVDNIEGLATYNLPEMETQVVSLRMDETKNQLYVL